MIKESKKTRIPKWISFQKFRYKLKKELPKQF